MPRVARLDTPGLLQHVIVRGVERREIFSDDRDRGRFVVRLSSLLEETETSCYAWALIPNHFSPFVKAGSVSTCSIDAATPDWLCGDIQFDPRTSVTFFRIATNQSYVIGELSPDWFVIFI
jgi:hypothetical protein